ncbi:hypothetical protein PAXRUDRAFT_262077 [Paxillus rubicundulus Ve08.2h10]|uniref:Uncharacterized protein n=1 Tax=Paxillus rubicundulus Ve08.2h10 TaxID=930991 RepID=A0A0D0CA93_9AGAM|nr:hypothetical protein PAXRUDRAFT_262077 [Paxillus rubicundulus Ve08.2h10]
MFKLFPWLVSISWLRWVPFRPSTSAVATEEAKSIRKVEDHLSLPLQSVQVPEANFVSEDVSENGHSN